MVKKSKKSGGRWPTILAVTSVIATSVIANYSLLRFQSAQQISSENSTDRMITISSITCLGRIEPEGEVIRLSGTVPPEGARVAQLLVKEGDVVRAGQVVAVLDSHDRLLAALKQAQENVKVTQARLAQVKEGSKAGDINAQRAAIARLEAELKGQVNAQQATIARLEAELRQARTDYQRNYRLYQEGAIAISSLESKRLAVETQQELLNEARANLNLNVGSLQVQITQAKATLQSLTEVRPVDVRVAQAEVDNANATLRKAEADLELAYVRAPVKSRVLEIQSRAGETITHEGIVKLSQTDQMNVIAEVYKTDIGKVRLGQLATITSDAFPEELRGEVTRIGLEVKQQNVFSTAPGADVDRKVVEVKISLKPADSQRVLGLIHLQVQVAIQL